VSAAPYGAREFEWTPDLNPTTAGDWENYLRAAAQAVSRKWGVGLGVNAVISADLPPAAGLSSSSALMVAFALALLRANGWDASFEELMDILPDGEQFVGTRGGGMDHAASLGSRAGCASMIEFSPLAVRHIPIPPGWAFLVAHSLHTAEKSGAVRERYNAVRAAGSAALRDLGFTSYAQAIQAGADGSHLGSQLGSQLGSHTRDVFLHVVTEAARVRDAVLAMQRNDHAGFGRLLLDSHNSLRDRLKVSTPALDQLVSAAMNSGALGARLTGGGFGGCAVVFCARGDRAAVRRGLMERYYAGRAEFEASRHLIDAEPGPGALHPD
jgi:galactokinase